MGGIAGALIVLAAVLAWTQTHGGVAPVASAILSSPDPAFDRRFLLALGSLIVAAAVLPDSVAIPGIALILLGAGVVLTK